MYGIKEVIRLKPSSISLETEKLRNNHSRHQPIKVFLLWWWRFVVYTGLQGPLFAAFENGISAFRLISEDVIRRESGVW
jgi:hypothetical protein